MIHEVDAALQALILQEARGTKDVEVVYEAPTTDWAGRRNAPTINVYLYDIREDLRRRSRGLVNEYAEDRVVARQLPPRYFKLSYLITAWTQRPTDEHRLLSALLECFLRFEAFPRAYLTGSLADLGLPVALTIGLPPPEDRSFADVWTALGGELKPSLDLVVSAPIDTGQRWAAGPPVDEQVLSFGGVGGWPPQEGMATRLDTAGAQEPGLPGSADGAARHSGSVAGSGTPGRTSKAGAKAAGVTAEAATESGRSGAWQSRSGSGTSGSSQAGTGSADGGPDAGAGLAGSGTGAAPSRSGRITMRRIVQRKDG